MTRRPPMIDDPVRPFPLKPGVRYQVVTDGEGRLVVREAKQKNSPERSNRKRFPCRAA
jgi:hypothetical protein